MRVRTSGKGCASSATAAKGMATISAAADLVGANLMTVVVDFVGRAAWEGLLVVDALISLKSNDSVDCRIFDTVLMPL